MNAIESSSSRRRFLRQIGIGLGAGVGVLAVPKVAKADIWVCCPDTSTCGGGCPQNQTKYLCRCSQWGLTDYCTGCQPSGNCYNGPC